MVLRDNATVAAAAADCAPGPGSWFGFAVGTDVESSDDQVLGLLSNVVHAVSRKNCQQ